MAREGLVDRPELWKLFLRFEPRLPRYPAIDAPDFRRSVMTFCQISP